MLTLDHRYADAVADFKLAQAGGEALDDYADYLGAQAAMQAGRRGGVRAAGPFCGPLSGQHLRADRAGAAGECASAAEDAQGALQVLQPLVNYAGGRISDFQYAWGGPINWRATRAMRRRLYARSI